MINVTKSTMGGLQNGTEKIFIISAEAKLRSRYGGIPLILTILITVCLAFMKVEEDNRKLEKAA